MKLRKKLNSARTDSVPSEVHANYFDRVDGTAKNARQTVISPLSDICCDTNAIHSNGFVEFILDSGASDHMMTNLEWLENAQEIVPKSITLGKGMRE